MKIEATQDLIDAQDRLVHAKQRNRNLVEESEKMTLVVLDYEQRLAEAESELEQARIDLALDDCADDLESLKKRFASVRRKTEKAREAYQEKSDLLSAIKNAIALSAQKTAEIRNNLRRCKRECMYESATGDTDKVTEALVEALADFATNQYLTRDGVPNLEQRLKEPLFKARKLAEDRYRELVAELDKGLVQA